PVDRRLHRADFVGESCLFHHTDHAVHDFVHSPPGRVDDGQHLEAHACEGHTTTLLVEPRTVEAPGDGRRPAKKKTAAGKAAGTGPPFAGITQSRFFGSTARWPSSQPGFTR